jgi:hypothetical protein
MYYGQAQSISEWVCWWPEIWIRMINNHCRQQRDECKTQFTKGKWSFETILALAVFLSPAHNLIPSIHGMVSVSGPHWDTNYWFSNQKEWGQTWAFVSPGKHCKHQCFDKRSIWRGLYRCAGLIWIERCRPTRISQQASADHIPTYWNSLALGLKASRIPALRSWFLSPCLTVN